MNIKDESVKTKAKLLDQFDDELHNWFIEKFEENSDNECGAIIALALATVRAVHAFDKNNFDENMSFINEIMELGINLLEKKED